MARSGAPPLSRSVETALQRCGTSGSRFRRRVLRTSGRTGLQRNGGMGMKPDSAHRDPSDLVERCKALAGLSVPGIVQITATIVTERKFAPPDAEANALIGLPYEIETPPFCRVQAVAQPSADSHINIA